ncbi:MAG TPA: carbohydrate kinase family protein [Candidatus Udaeobacter sp.]|nr:carbohydrate kinase family protein [Candidatus Udaeobacter sp.]
MYNLITIGDALIDTNLFIDEATLECDVNKQNCQICLNFASKIPLTNSFQTLGGNAANVAAATAKLGLKTAILTSIGKDANGEMVKAELKKDKVDTTLLSMDKKIKTRYSMVLNFKKERTILSYHQHRTYNFPKKLPKTDWVYYTSLSEGYEKFQEDLLKFLNKNSNINLAYNPGSIQLKNLEFTKQVLSKTNILIVNLEEAKKILGLSSEEKNIKILINGLLNLGAKEIVITNSEAGAWAGNSSGVWHINSIPTEVVSKTGAGDAFSAGYLAARFYKHDIATALSWGIVNSSAAISSSAQEKNLLNKKEISKMISKFSSIKPTKI